MSYSKSVEIALPYEEAIGAVKEAFKAEGFGTLTEIDVRAMLKEKLGVESEPRLIIGACNPTLAHQALSIEPSVAVLLPCNVVVRGRDDHCEIEVMDPNVLSSLGASHALDDVAAEADRRIERALAALTTQHPRLAA
jgi:uncharacterized protein (DUF302 family)